MKTHITILLFKYTYYNYICLLYEQSLLALNPAIVFLSLQKPNKIQGGMGRSTPPPPKQDKVILPCVPEALSFPCSTVGLQQYSSTERGTLSEVHRVKSFLLVLNFFPFRWHHKWTVNSRTVLAVSFTITQCIRGTLILHSH